MIQTPLYLTNFLVVRFDARNLRHTARRRSLADYLAAVSSDAPQAVSKDRAPTWSLCNDTGDSAGSPNGLVQIDLDDVLNVSGIREALIGYGGLLVVTRSFSGHGLYAIGYVGARVASDPDAVERYVYSPLRAYLLTHGYTDGVHYKLDTSCGKPCQLRYESRDRDAWVSQSFTRLWADPEDDAPLSWHPVSTLAEALCPAFGGLSPAGLAAAMTCISMSADLRSRMHASATAFAARAFCVVIGDPGCGKTTLLNAVQDVAQAMRITVSDPKNAPTLREHILACGCDEVISEPESGKRTGTRRLIERTTSPADSLCVCIDEAGQRLRTRVQDESCGSLAAMLRQCNGERITLEGTVKQEHCGSYRVPAHVSVLLGTTLPQWAEYTATVRQDNGESRRIAEFYQPGQTRDIFTDAPPRADLAGIVDMLNLLRETAKLWSDAGRILEPDPSARAAFRAACVWLSEHGLDIPSAQSLVMCYATLCAGLRASISGPAAILYSDLAACVAILRRVIEARGLCALEQQRATDSVTRTDGSVFTEIMSWVASCPRRDKILEKLARRPPQYRRVYDEMLYRGALVVYRDEKSGKYSLRQASAEELERNAERLDTLRQPQSESTDSSARKSATSYADCSEAEREERVLAYYTEFRRDNPLAVGERNNSLSRLAYNLQRAGMWDDVAKRIYSEVARNSGLGEAEIRTLMRERKIAKN